MPFTLFPNISINISTFPEIQIPFEFFRGNCVIVILDNLSKNL